MKDLLDYIVKNIVTKPEDVVINEENREDGIAFSLTVNPEDMGKIIGKGGKTIQAVRKLLVARTLAENRNLRVNLTLVEVGK